MKTKQLSMTTVPPQECVAVVDWWLNVQMLADSFFRMLQTPPSQDESMLHMPDMMALHRNHRCIHKLDYPPSAEEIRAHLLLSMLSLESSILEVIEQKPQSSDVYYRAARTEYAIAEGLLARYGMID